LLSPIRSESNYRYYSDETLLRLKIIEVMKAQRFTLEEIKEQLNLFEEDQPTSKIPLLFIINPLSGAFLSRLFSTHPPIQERVEKLRRIKL